MNTSVTFYQFLRVFICFKPSRWLGPVWWQTLQAVGFQEWILFYISSRNTICKYRYMNIYYIQKVMCCTCAEDVHGNQKSHYDPLFKPFSTPQPQLCGNLGIHPNPCCPTVSIYGLEFTVWLSNAFGFLHKDHKDIYIYLKICIHNKYIYIYVHRVILH